MRSGHCVLFMAAFFVAGVALRNMDHSSHSSFAPVANTCGIAVGLPLLVGGSDSIGSSP